MSASASGILKDWALGDLSGPKLKRQMWRQVKDDRIMGNQTHPEVLALAKCGGSSMVSGNIHRDLMKRVSSLNLNELITTVDGKRICRVMQPHHLANVLSNVYPNVC